MKKLATLFLPLMLLGLASCNRHGSPEELVANAARQYYSYLLEGNYEAFVDGCYQPDTIRAFYRLQLVENAKMFIAQQKRERQGIRSFEVAKVEVDTAAHTANAFLRLEFGDGSQEQVLLPMVEHKKLWYMR